MNFLTSEAVKTNKEKDPELLQLKKLHEQIKKLDQTNLLNTRDNAPAPATIRCLFLKF